MNKEKKSKQAGNIIMVVLALATGVLAGMLADDVAHWRHPVDADLQNKMTEVMELVAREYVDPVDVDSLGEWMIGLLLDELDPHSIYLSARETERTDEMMRGSFEGVGLVLHREGDTTYVGQVLPDGPSAGSGILPGDMIECVGLDKVSGVGMPSDSVVARLRGPRGSNVSVQVKRFERSSGDTLTMVYHIRRGVVDHKSLPLATMLNDTTGYVLLTTFSTTSHGEFRDALRVLKSDGMKHLILDLRGNGGGALAGAIGIAGELLPQGSLIVYTQGSHTGRKDARARDGGLFTEGRVTVLIDEGSASASEVVSGALQDNDRAQLMGRRTFGKGLVQTEYALQDGSSVLLTTARYYTPSGRCIQRPYTEGTDEYYRSYLQQLINEAYSDTLAVTDSTPYYTVGGRLVHGGGGITPDHVLPYRKDTSFGYFNRLSAAGAFSQVAFHYVRSHVGELQDRFPDGETFSREFVLDEALVREAVVRGERAGVPRDEVAIAAQRGLMANRIKAFIGQSLFGDATFYLVTQQEDDDLKAVLEILRQQQRH